MANKTYYTRDILYLCEENGTPFVTDDIDLASMTAAASGIPYKQIEYKTPEPYFGTAEIHPSF